MSFNTHIFAKEEAYDVYKRINPKICGDLINHPHFQMCRTIDTQ